MRTPGAPKSPTLLIVALALIAPAVSAQFGGFTWTLAGDPAGTGTQTADVLHVVGPDIGGMCAGNGAATWFQTVAPVTGHVTAVAQYHSFDDPEFDEPVEVLDGSPVLVPCSPPECEWFDGTYTFDFDVFAGQSFGFGVWSWDCFGGPGVIDVTAFTFTPIEWFPVGAPIDPQLGPYLGGLRLAGAGDVNGDGHADVLAGPGGVGLYSGHDGALLLEETGDMSLGSSLASAGDLDGDGVPDFVAGAPMQPPLDTGAVFAWSGATGAELFEHHGTNTQQRLGAALAAVGDIDGDGLCDIAASWGKPLGRVLLLSGSDGHVIAELVSGLAKDNFGSAVAGVGDADLDGVPDLLVGAPAINGPLPSGIAYLYSGATHALLLSIAGGHKQFAQDVAPAGDVDGDGRADLLVADPLFQTGAVAIGRVASFSGQDGALLQQVTGAPGSALAGVASGGADVTADGVPDIVTAVRQPAVALRVYSGADLSLFHEFTVPGNPGSELRVAIVGDIDANGTADTGIATTVGIYLVKALAGLGAPHLSGSGEVAGNAPITLTVDHGRPSAAAVLVLGATSLQQPLLGGVLVPWPALLLPFAIDAGGGAQFTGRWPPGLPVGSSLWIQAWIVDPDGPSGWTCTNGLVAGQLGP